MERFFDESKDNNGREIYYFRVNQLVITYPLKTVIDIFTKVNTRNNTYLFQTRRYETLSSFNFLLI